ncbi:MAG TPA: HIT family protein [Nevskiaceae bacterium]|nr:HIT family protein [Nevskiaceae bacterium]
MSEPTLFDKIVDGSIPSFKVWEDDQYLAFLTPFANTPGATVVVPKKNPGDYVFNLDDSTVAGLMTAAKKVAKLLEKGLDVPRVAAVFEGEAVPHVHVKLYPMHNFAADRSQLPKTQVFFPAYPGYIDTHDGPRMDDVDLKAVQQKIQETGNA